MFTTLAANLLGLSDSLTAIERSIRIRRQGNGNFTVYRSTTFKDGRHGVSDIAVNVASLCEARTIAQREAA